MQKFLQGCSLNNFLTYSSWTFYKNCFMNISKSFCENSYKSSFMDCRNSFKMIPKYSARNSLESFFIYLTKNASMNFLIDCSKGWLNVSKILLKYDSRVTSTNFSKGFYVDYSKNFNRDYFENTYRDPFSNSSSYFSRNFIPQMMECSKIFSISFLFLQVFINEELIHREIFLGIKIFLRIYPRPTSEFFLGLLHIFI